MIKRRFSIILFLAMSSLQAGEFVFATPEQESAYHQLLKEFRCVTCPNQSIADSRAPIAEAMQEDIYLRLRQGESPEEIKSFLQENYGDYVLYRPPFKAQNIFLWLAPLIFLACGIMGWAKWRR